MSSLRVGQSTFLSSRRTSRRNWRAPVRFRFSCCAARRVVVGGAARRSTPDPFWRRSAFSCARFICRFMLLPLQARRDSNPQPPVLETGALPVELRAFGAGPPRSGPRAPQYSPAGWSPRPPSPARISPCRLRESARSRPYASADGDHARPQTSEASDEYEWFFPLRRGARALSAWVLPPSRAGSDRAGDQRAGGSAGRALAARGRRSSG